MKKLYQRLAEKQIQGLMFHSDMADFYAFLNLKIFRDFHDKRFIEECQTLRAIKNYFIDNWHQTLSTHDFVPAVEITPQDWEEKTSSEIDKTSIALLLKESYKKYYDWEEDVEKDYSEIASQMFDWGFYDDYLFVSNTLIQGVRNEKNKIMDVILDLSSVDYDYRKIKGLQYKMQ